MSLLPQLERELLAAHERRAARPWWRRAVGPERIAVIASVSVALGVAVVAVVALGRHGPSRPAGTSGRAPAATTLLRDLNSPNAYPTPAGLFVSDRVSATQSRLMRIDPLTGAITCDITFGGSVEDLEVAGGAVWVTTTSGSRHSLWRLDSESLVKLSPVVRLGSSPPSAGPTGSLAVAGGWLWVGGLESIERVSLATGGVTARTSVPGAQGVELAADRGGRVLLDSVRSGGSDFPSRVQRRDARSGAKLAEVSAGLPRPVIAGVLDGLAWVKVNRPTAGWVTSLNARTLRATSRTRGSADVDVVVGADVVLVAHAFGGTDYCFGPRGGNVEGTFSLSAGAHMLAADRNSIYSARRFEGAGHVELVRAPLPRGCR